MKKEYDMPTFTDLIEQLKTINVSSHREFNSFWEDIIKFIKENTDTKTHTFQKEAMNYSGSREEKPLVNALKALVDTFINRIEIVDSEDEKMDPEVIQQEEKLKKMQLVWKLTTLIAEMSNLRDTFYEKFNALDKGSIPDLTRVEIKTQLHECRQALELGGRTFGTLLGRPERVDIVELKTAICFFQNRIPILETNLNDLISPLEQQAIEREHSKPGGAKAP
jgi:hypothetical protein